MATPVKNSLLKLLTNFILFLTYLYGSQSSSMTVLTARQTSIFQLNPKTFLLLFGFMKTLLTLITEFLWTLKVLFPHLLKTTPIFLLLLTHLVISSLLTQLLTLLPNMQFKLFSIIGLQSLVPLNILSQIEVLNILIKTWLIFVLSFILTIHLELFIHHGPMVWSKSKTETLELISGYFYKILLLTGHFKLKCTHMLIIQHLFLSLNFLHIRLFSIPILAYLSVTAACPYPALRLDKLYAALIRCLVLWTVTKQILVFLF